jgi:hypothetical protein
LKIFLIIIVTFFCYAMILYLLVGFIVKRIFKKKFSDQKKEDVFFQSVFVVVTISLSLGFLGFMKSKNYYVIYQFRKPFRESLEIIISDPQKARNSVHSDNRANVILIESRNKKKYWIVGDKIKKSDISDLNIKLINRKFPVAHSFEEAGTFVMLDFKDIVVGNYVRDSSWIDKLLRIDKEKYGKAFRTDCHISIIDRARGSITQSFIIKGAEPLKFKSGGGDYHGSAPEDKEIINELMTALQHG